MQSDPLISIVTPCLNRAQFIGEAIESVLHQDYPHFEHIIVDGGSTDGTLDIVQRYPHLRVISEPDQGVYDALNKGIRLAQGEIIGHLNSDDFYEKNIFAEVARQFAADPQLDAVYGGATVFEQEADGSRQTIAEYLSSADVELSWQNITIGVPIINARFFRKRVYDRIGLYNTTYRIAADRDFLMRVALAHVKSAPLASTVYHYRQHPGSLTINTHSPYAVQTINEYLDIAERYLNVDGIAAESRRYCKLWYTKETIEGAVLALRGMRPSDVVRYSLRGWRHDLRWPIALASVLLPKLVRLPLKLFRRRHGGA